MVVQRFVKWYETANTSQRSAGVRVLAEAWVENAMSDEERRAAVAALTHVLDDPSPKVRLALATVLAPLSSTPRHLVLALAEDIDDIACLVAEHSPVLSCADLVDLFASGSPRLRGAIAGRCNVSTKLSAAIAEVGDASAAAMLLSNVRAAITAASFRRLAERHGANAGVRALLLERRDIPADVRQRLILELGHALAGMPIVRHTVGEGRACRLVFDSCERATATLADDIETSEIPAFVEHLRISGQLSTAFLIRIVCTGNIDLFAAALVALGNFSERRVRAIIVDGRESPFDVLIKACGLPAAAGPLLRTAIRTWKQTIAGGFIEDADDVSAIVMSRLAAAFRDRRHEAGFEAMAALLERLEVESVRTSARHVVQRMAAA